MYEATVKLGISNDLHIAVNEGGVQNISEWKRNVKSRAAELDRSRKLVATFIHPSLIHIQLLALGSTCSRWWTLGDKFPYLRLKCKMMVKFSLGYIDGINYKNDRKCMMCTSVKVDSVFHFLCECDNTSMVSLRNELYDTVIKFLGIYSMSMLGLADVCLLGDIFDDKTAIKVLNIVSTMYQKRKECITK